MEQYIIAKGEFMRSAVQSIKRILYNILILSALTAGIFLTGCAGEVLKGEVARSKQKEMELAQQLETARKHAAHQDEKNAELIRQQALYKRDSQSEFDEVSRINSELVAANRVLKAQNEELLQIKNDTERQLKAQTVSFSKSPSVTIIPNNSAVRNELTFENPQILPPRRVGENVVIELPDSLLFTREITVNTTGEIKRLTPIFDNKPAIKTDDRSSRSTLESENQSVSNFENKTLLKNDHLLPTKNESPQDHEKGPLVLSKEGKNILREAALEIRRNYPKNIYRLEGHSDQSELFSKTSDSFFQEESSLNKAVLAARFLVREAGIPYEQIEICGCGGARPVVENNTDENRQRNRRIEWGIRPERRQ